MFLVIYDRHVDQFAININHIDLALYKGFSITYNSDSELRS